MTHNAVAPQAPDNARRALAREVGKLVGEIRKMFFEVERSIVSLAQKQCPVTGLTMESCAQCQNTALGNVPFTFGKHPPHFSELEAMIDAISPTLRETIKKSSVFF